MRFGRWVMYEKPQCYTIALFTDAQRKFANEELIQAELHPLLSEAETHFGYQRIKLYLWHIAQMQTHRASSECWIWLFVSLCKHWFDLMPFQVAGEQILVIRIHWVVFQMENSRDSVIM